MVANALKILGLILPYARVAEKAGDIVAHKATSIATDLTGLWLMRKFLMILLFATFVTAEIGFLLLAAQYMPFYAACLVMTAVTGGISGVIFWRIFRKVKRSKGRLGRSQIHGS
jgi:hypothetical protein